MRTCRCLNGQRITPIVRTRTIARTIAFPLVERNWNIPFGPTKLLRRHEYTEDVLGNAPGLNYASHYRVANGLMVPHKRRVFAYDREKRKVAEPLLVAVNIHEIEFN
jgi:hypothetical protein